MCIFSFLLSKFLLFFLTWRLGIKPLYHSRIKYALIDSRQVARDITIHNIGNICSRCRRCSRPPAAPRWRARSCVSAIPTTHGRKFELACSTWRMRRLSSSKSYNLGGRLDHLPGQRLTGRDLLVPQFLCLFLFSVPQVFVFITSYSWISLLQFVYILLQGVP